MNRHHGIDAPSLLQESRARAGLSQRDLALRAGTAQPVVARIELGASSPTVSTLNRLLRAAGVRPVIDLRAGGSPPRTIPDPDVVMERVRAFVESGEVEGVASAYLFGSAARGHLHRESDVDIAVLLDRMHYPTKLERGEARVRIASELMAVLGVNEVDLVVLNDLPPGFGRAIVTQGRRIARANPELDHAFVRDVQLLAADLDPFLRRMRAIKLEALRK